MRVSILIGAGASFGCGYALDEHRPPLGRGPGLYRELAHRFPATWGSISDQSLIEALSGDFETGMALAWERQRGATSHLLIDLAVYFTEFDPPAGGRDCYTALVREIRNSRLLSSTAVISLNYDCILEMAASRLRVLLRMTDPAAGELLILKPHGSCNFLPTAKVQGLTIQLSGPDGRYYDGPFRVAQPAEVRAAYAGEMGLAVPPVMSVYAPGKHNPVCAPALVEIREVAAEWSRGSDYVLCIGARPTLSDPHIWDPLIDSGAPIWFVGGADEDLDALRDAAGPKRVEHLSPYFEESIAEIRKRLHQLARPPR